MDYPKNEAAQLALQQMSKMVRDAKTNVDVRAFARRVAAPYRTTAERARALLDVIRSHVRYTPDPVGSEHIVAPFAIFAGALPAPADDDDMAVAFATACESVDIVTELKLVPIGRYAFTVVVVVHEDDRKWTFYMHEPQRSE